MSPTKTQPPKSYENCFSAYEVLNVDNVVFNMTKINFVLETCQVKIAMNLCLTRRQKNDEKHVIILSDKPNYKTLAQKASRWASY